tara:strand:- start:101058 stop:101957 length:900 start_codon:yes stop_codon:yes gene_type:complete
MLGDFLKSVKSTAGNKDVDIKNILETCSSLISEAESLAETCHRAKGVLDLGKLKSSNSRDFALRFVSVVKNKGTIGETLGHCCQTAARITDGILKIFEDKKDFTVHSMTTHDGTMLQLLDLANFFIENARRYVLLSLHYEQVQDKKGFSDSTYPPYTKKEIQELDVLFPDFCKVALYFFKNHTSEAKDILAQVPNEVFSFDSAELMNSSRYAKTPQVNNLWSPKRLGVSGFIFSLLSYIAMIQANRLDVAEEEVKAIEAHIIELEESSVENAYAIDYHTKRLRVARDKLDKLKKKYRIE